MLGVCVFVFRGVTAGDDRSWTLKWGDEENCKQLFSNVVRCFSSVLERDGLPSTRGTTVAVPPPFRLCDPALSGSHSLVTPY